MKIVIGQETYTVLTNLTFEPEVDVTGNTVPINEFSADIQTTDVIDMGQAAELRDDRDKLYAKYYITYAERVLPGRVHVIAQSPLCLLGNNMLPAVMYSGKTAQAALDETLNNLGSSLGSDDWVLASSLRNVQLNGFCPEQTARDRLQWICYVLGAYVKQAFDSKLKILTLDRTVTQIPRGITYWRPTVNYLDYVTKIQTKRFAFDQREPVSGEDYVVDGNGTKYVVTSTYAALIIDGIPQGVQDNVLTVDDIMLINQDNVDSVLGRLAGQYFPRTEVEGAAIDNGDYIPGDYVRMFVDEETVMEGFVQRASFAFGKQAKATLQLVGASIVPMAALEIVYIWGEWKLGRAEYIFPVGYVFEVENPYIDKWINDHRYVFRPTLATTTGTMTSGGVDARIECEPALDLYDGVLHIINVDEITEETGSGGETIGVIA